MEFDKLSPYILRGEIYVKEAGERLLFTYKGFEDIRLLTLPNNREVYLKIKGHITTWLIPIAYISAWNYADKFFIRVEGKIWNYGFITNNKLPTNFVSNLDNKKIELVYKSDKDFTRAIIIDPFSDHTIIIDKNYNNPTSVLPEYSNFFIITRNKITYLIVIL